MKSCQDCICNTCAKRETCATKPCLDCERAEERNEEKEITLMCNRYIEVNK